MTSYRREITSAIWSTTLVISPTQMSATARSAITKADGTPIGDFTVNQAGDTSIALPADAVPSAPGDGKLTIKDAEGTTLGEFTADQATGTDTEVTLPATFSGDYDDLINKPDIGDGKITIVDADGDPVGEFTVNQAGDTEISLPEIPVPEDQIHIGDTYPGTPSTGDLWVDTSECPPVLQIWSDCEDPNNPGWLPIGGGGAEAITFTAVITDDGTPAANTPGHILTASATNIQGGTTPAEYEYKWLVDGLTMGQAKTLNIISTFVGKIVSCEVTVAEPDGSDPVNKTAIYSKTIELGVEIKKPEVLTPPAGAGIGGDVTYTPETSAIITDGVEEVKGGGAVNAAEDNGWFGVAYGNGLYVAVARDGTNRVMYSSNAINWNSASAVEATGWNDIAFGNGKFVAVADGGTNRTMYSSDGINWTAGTPALTNDMRAVGYGNGLFVAVGTDEVSYSSDGINWSTTATAASNVWAGVAYGNGKYVAVARNSASQAMYSTDGINWTTSSIPTGNYYDVTYGDGKFVAVANSGGTLAAVLHRWHQLDCCMDSCL